MKKNLLLFLLSLHLFVSAQVPSMLKDISPGFASSSFGAFYVMPNNDLIFGVSSATAAYSGVTITDGSTAGTNILKTLSNGMNLASNVFVPYNGKVYMNAGTSYSAVPLWRTDGTTAGTDSLPIQGISGVGQNSIGTMSVFLNLIFFTTGNNTLWRSDGTAAGSYSIASGLTLNSFVESSNNILFFTAGTSSTGVEWWRTDGTVAGTYMLKDIWPGPTSGMYSTGVCGRYNNLLFFVASDPINGTEVWKTDGTINGTTLLKDIYPGTASSILNYQNFWSGNSGVFFVANEPTSGTELWYTDGTTANTYLLINAGTGTLSSSYGIPIFIGNTAYLFNYLNQAIYKTNGTIAGTSSISAVGVYTGTNSGQSEFIINYKKLIEFNNELYYVTAHRINQLAGDFYFRKVDKNLTSINLVQSEVFLGDILLTGSTIVDMSALIGNNHFVYFVNRQGGNNLVCIFNPVTLKSRQFPVVTNFTAYYNTSDYFVNNKFYFPFQKSESGPGYLDLNTDSLVPLDVNNANLGFYCPGTINGSDWEPKLYKLNNKYYFINSSTNYGFEFHQTDFTLANTQLVKDIYPGQTSFFPPGNNCTYKNIFPTVNNIYFIANDGINGTELWSFINSPNNPAGIKHQGALKQDIRLYPNPANDVLHFKSNHSIHSIKIYNTMGDLLKSQFLNDNQQITEIEINQLAKGIYLVEIETQAGKETRKFVKE